MLTATAEVALTVRCVAGRTHPARQERDPPGIADIADDLGMSALNFTSLRERAHPHEALPTPALEGLIAA